MERIPTEEELDNHYSTYSYASDRYLSDITIKSYNALLNSFERYRENNRILDVGCGRGWFLEEARKRGWAVYGTEYSKKAIEICESKGIRMKEGKLDSTSFDTKEFDVVTSFEVIEHINNPNEELNHINLLLRSGGFFYCTTPNFNSIMRYYLKSDYNIIEYPEHLSYYTKTTLNNAAVRNGFDIVKVLSTGLSITRIKTSKKISSEKLASENSSDELLRQKINKKWYLNLTKHLTNKILTATSLGMTLKGYYVKP